MKTNIYNIIIKYEWILFYAFVILNLIPAIQVPFFPSLDGAAHLYNAKIIHNLIFSDSEVLRNFYAFNTEIVPNWGAHFILTFLYSFFSATVVNKIFIAMCLFSLPASFRFCVKKINSSAIFTTYLIFPFTYTFMFCLGFYNFYVGLIILFTAIGVLSVYRENKLTIKYIITLFILISLSYLSHLFVFLSLGIYMFFLCSIDVFQSVVKKENVKYVIKKTGVLFLISLAPLVLTINYFTHPHGTNGKVYLLKTELLEWITNCRSIVCYSFEDDVIYSTIIFFVILFLFSIAIYVRGKEFQKNLSEGSKHFVFELVSNIKIQDSILIIIAAFTFLYFKLPDSDSSAGFISSRLNLMIFLFVILWVSSCDYPKWVSIICFIFIFYSSCNLLKVHAKAFQNLNKEISEIVEIEPSIKENSIVFPLNYSDNWLSQHNSNFLGLNKPMIILENYECNNSYFPLSWNCDADMIDLINCDKAKFYEKLNANNNSAKQIDYVFVQNKDRLPDSLKTKILENFMQKKETKTFILFEKKENNNK